jgi:hypothetical protein
MNNKLYSNAIHLWEVITQVLTKYEHVIPGYKSAAEPYDVLKNQRGRVEYPGV